MSVQEAAIYGDLVLALRDYAAGQVAALTSERDKDAARTHLDEFIHTWFFTPQERLYGSTPREVIWREQLGEQNPIPKEYAAEVYSDDCPICQRNRPRYAYCESCQANGRKTVATWICYDCSNQQEYNVLVCEDCLMQEHEDHWVNEILY